MTNIDLKRAREVADAIESPYPYLHLNEAASLIRSLCEIVEKLPVTADGVPITPGMKLWTDNDGEIESGTITSLYPVNGEMMVGCSGWEQAPRDCYSTREAALAAAGKGKSGDAATIPPG